MTSPALLLAQIRVSGATTPPPLLAERAALEAAARRAGRVLVDASRPSQPRVALSWLDGSEPAVEDPNAPRHLMAETGLVTLAACLRACWPNPHTHPFPGVDARDTAIVSAVLAMTARGPGRSADATSRHVIGHLRKLRRLGYLDEVPDEPSAVRLGPLVAAWTSMQIRVLVNHYDLLPDASETP